MSQKIIDKTFRPLYGEPCWGVYYDRQLHLSMNFGEPSLEVREPFKTNTGSNLARRMAASRRITIRGEWWLWICCCYWRLTFDGLGVTTDSSSLRQIERATKQLDGQKLVSVEVEPDTSATRFIFDLGCVLRCRRIKRDSDADLWMLYKPRGFVLSVRGNGTFSHQRSAGVSR